MTDEEVLIVYNDIEKWYGKPLPNFEHEPMQFAYIFKLYKYHKMQQNP